MVHEISLEILSPCVQEPLLGSRGGGCSLNFSRTVTVVAAELRWYGDLQAAGLRGTAWVASP